MTKVSVLKKNKCSYLYNSFVSVKCWTYCFQTEMRAKIAKFSWDYAASKTPNYICNKLVRQHLVLLGFFPICHIFPMIDQCRFFFTSGIGPDILMNMYEDCIILHFWAFWVSVSILSKNKDFQCRVLLKIPPSFPLWRSLV